MGFRDVWKEYMKNSSLHGAKFIVDEKYQYSEKFFWIVCVFISWMASVLLMQASLDAFQNNAISFVVETSFLDWKTHFPSIAICESKNLDGVQEISERLWGIDHDFTLEEVLSELTFFRGESYHTVHECGGTDPIDGCLFSGYKQYAQLVRSNCTKTLKDCQWNAEKKFNCCDYFFPMETELGTCYTINSMQTENPRKMKMPMISDKYTGPGKFTMEILTEANIYILGEEDVPHLVTPKSEMLPVSPYISYYRLIAMKNIENDPETRDVNVNQRNCRYPDENILDVHKFYSYSACSVQCRKDAQLKICNCTNHLMPLTPTHLHCNISGLICLNEHYEELSVVIPKWSSHGRKGVVCDCLPSCTEIDVSIVHDSKEKGLVGDTMENRQAIAQVELELSALPTERYKRNVVRGRLDLVVSGIVIAVYVYFTWHFDHWAKKGIPGPNAKFFFGNFPSNVTQNRNMVYDADDIYQQYRDKFNFVGFYHMRAPGLMALNPETIKEILIRKFRNFHDNEFADMGDKEVDKMFSRNPFMLQGDEWKEKRAEITPAFTPARIKTLFPVIEDVCTRLNDYVKANNKDALEVRELCAKYATDVVSSAIFGVDAQSFTTEKPAIRKMGIKLMNPSFSAILYFILIEILPFMHKIIKMPFVPKEVETFFVNLMRDAVALRKKNKIERVDFLHYLLELKEKKGLADVDIAAHAVTFFLDGFETSSVAMSYALYELARNPEVQDKLREEIRETEREHGKITFEHLHEMPYLEQVMMETLRRRSPALLLSKKCTESCELELIEGEKKTIDMDMCIMIPIYSIHLDPLYYENPLEFNPERFSPECGGTKSYREKGVFIPFGDGPRACLGQKFALTQVKAGIVDIIRNYQLFPNSKTQEPLLVAPGEFTSAPVGGLWLNFKELS